jgi:Glycosyltransferase family 87
MYPPAMPPSRREPLLSWLARLYRGAPRAARALFVALALLFAFRAGFPARGDRAGFQLIGAQLLDGRLFADRDVNTYPPPFAVVMAPLEWLRRRAGDYPVRLAWGAAQLACLVYLTRAGAALLAPAAGLGAVALSWLASWRYVVGDLNNQNVSLFLVALVARALALDRARRGAAAGALLGVGALVKLWPAAALVPLLLAPRRRAARAAGGFLAAVVAGLAATAAAFGPARALDAWRFWIGIAPQVGGPALLNQSLRGLALRLLVPGADLRSTTRMPPVPEAATARLVAMALGLALAAAVVGWVVRLPARSDRARALDGFLCVLAVMPALPVVWFHYEVASVPVLLAIAAGEPRGRWRRWAVALAVTGTALAGFLDVDLVGRRVWRAAAFAGNALVGSLLLLAAGLVLRAAWQAQDRADVVRADVDESTATG